jgi:chromosome partitioning protein
LTSIALLSNKSSVGTTTLTYHLAHMIHRLGHHVLTVDLDPQSNLTTAFLDEEQLEVLWPEGSQWPNSKDYLGGTEIFPDRAGTVAKAVQPIMEGVGDVEFFDPVQILDGLWLVPGDLALSSFEDRLSVAWPRESTGNDHEALRATTAFYRIIRHAAEQTAAEIVLIDVGPNLGAINRAAAIAADSVLMPVTAEISSLRGLRYLGRALRDWHATWENRGLRDIPPNIPAPLGSMTPLGYVIMHPTMRLDRPAYAYQRRLERIPAIFHSAVLGEEEFDPADRSYEIAALRSYQSLLPLSRDARKPMFDLRAADGALGSTQTYVQKCYQDFKELSRELLERLNQIVPPI